MPISPQLSRILAQKWYLMSDLEFQSYIDFNQNAQWLQLCRLQLSLWEGFHEIGVNIKSDLSLQGECGIICQVGLLSKGKGRESFWVAWKEFRVIRNPPKEPLPLIPFCRLMLPSYRYVCVSLTNPYVRGVIENMLGNRQSVADSWPNKGQR